LHEIEDKRSDEAQAAQVRTLKAHPTGKFVVVTHGHSMLALASSLATVVRRE